jgi:HK97 family phage major capsid protein
MELTKDQLTEHIRDTFKSILPAELLEVVQAQIAPYQKAQTDLVAQMLSARNEPPAREKGLAFARIVRALAAGKTGQQPVADVLKGWGDEDLAKAVTAQQKALAASVGSAGGFIVPEQFSTDIIPLRRAMTVVRGSGPREIPMPTGTVKIPKLASGATGGYIGENVNAPVSQPSFGSITLTWKKLAVLVPVSNDLLRYSSPAADAVVRDDVVAGLAVTEDAVFLRSQGVNGEPTGLRYLAPPTNVLDANGTVSLANVSTDLGKAMLQLKNNNVPMIRPMFLLSPRSEFYLLTVQNSNGYFAFRDEMVTRRTIYGVPYKTTTSIPNTLTFGAYTDASEVYLVDFDSIALGDSQRLTIDVSTEGAYMSGGVAVSAFSLDQTIVRAIAEHDLGARDANAICVLNGVRWGA